MQNMNYILGISLFGSTSSRKSRYSCIENESCSWTFFCGKSMSRDQALKCLSMLLAAPLCPGQKGPENPYSEALFSILGYPRPSLAGSEEKGRQQDAKSALQMTWKWQMICKTMTRYSQVHSFMVSGQSSDR